MALRDDQSGLVQSGERDRKEKRGRENQAVELCAECGGHWRRRPLFDEKKVATGRAVRCDRGHAMSAAVVFVPRK